MLNYKNKIQENMFKVAALTGMVAARSAWQNLKTLENTDTLTKSEIRWSSITMKENEEARINGTIAIDYAPGKAPLSQDNTQVRMCLTFKNKDYPNVNNQNIEEYE